MMRLVRALFGICVICVLAAVLPGAALAADAPTVYTDSAAATGLTTATVDWIVNPAGQTTTYKVEYGLASSTWCTSGGSSGSPAHTTTPQTLGFTDGTFHDVSVDLTGLTAGTGYCTDPSPPTVRAARTPTRSRSSPVLRVRSRTAP